MNKNDKNSKPGYGSVQIFEQGMMKHHAVKELIKTSDYEYTIHRNKDRESLQVRIADIYILGEANFIEVLDNTELDIDVLVLVGYYNRYGASVETLAKDMGIEIFNRREFYGALNYEGEKFTTYARRDTD